MYNLGYNLYALLFYFVVGFVIIEQKQDWENSKLVSKYKYKI